MTPLMSQSHYNDVIDRNTQWHLSTNFWWVFYNRGGVKKTFWGDLFRQIFDSTKKGMTPFFFFFFCKKWRFLNANFQRRTSFCSKLRSKFVPDLYKSYFGVANHIRQIFDKKWSYLDLEQKVMLYKVIDSHYSCHVSLFFFRRVFRLIFV